MNLDQYLSAPGAESMAAFARRLNVNQDQVRQWRHETGGRRPSPQNCAEIERESRGAVSCEELRPDLVWTRVKDRDWPHKNGRPLLDVARESA